MRDDELDGLRFVRLQIRFQKLQFLRRKSVRTAIVQNREMRLPVVETEVRQVGRLRRTRRVLLKQRRRTRRPNVMISGSEKQREALQKVTDAENRLKKGEKLSPDEQEKMLQAEQIQCTSHHRT